MNLGGYRGCQLPPAAEGPATTAVNQRSQLPLAAAGPAAAAV